MAGCMIEGGCSVLGRYPSSLCQRSLDSGVSTRWILLRRQKDTFPCGTVFCKGIFVASLFCKERNRPPSVWNFRRIGVSNERRVGLSNDVPGGLVCTHSCHGGYCGLCFRWVSSGDREVLALLGNWLERRVDGLPGSRGGWLHGAGNKERSCFFGDVWYGLKTETSVNEAVEAYSQARTVAPDFQGCKGAPGRDLHPEVVRCSNEVQQLTS